MRSLAVSPLKGFRRAVDARLPSGGIDGALNVEKRASEAPSAIRIEWPDPDGNTIADDVPEHLAVIVRALGLDDAATFFLTFGGAPIYVGRRPRKEGAIVQALGFEAARKLAHAIGRGHIKVPVAAEFVARHMRSKGASVYEIARTLHRTDTTVRRLLRLEADRQATFAEESEL